MILDDNLDEAGARDEAEGAFSDVDTERIDPDASLHNTFATSELASVPTKFMNASSPDIEKGYYIRKLALRLESCEQHAVPSASAQTQPQTLSQSFKPLQDQINQQGISRITWSMSVKSALHSLLKLSDSGDDEWTDENMAELKKELGLTLKEQQVKSSLVGTSIFSSSCSVEASQNETQSWDRTETTSSRSEELQDTSWHDTAQGLEEWKQQKTEVVMKGGAIAMQQQKELAAQKKELEHPAVGDQQDLVEVVDANDPEDKEATEALPAAQPKIFEINEHCFQLRGVRARQLAERQTKTTQYRVVWGEYSNRSDSWFNEDDIWMSMPWPPCELYSQNLTLQTEMNIFWVCEMRSSWRKGRKVFEYLVNVFNLDAHTWITEDQLRISLSPMLVAEPKGNWLPHEGLILEILRNRLLTEHILNSAFSSSLESSTVWGSS